jgi:hypothetical protein
MNQIRHVRAFNREVPVFPKEAVDQRIEAILNNFPFDKVRAAMTALKYTWRGEGEPPTETAMQSNARRLLQRAAVMREGEAIDSGGFRARPGANGDLTLEFVLAHQDEAFSEEDDEGNPAAPGFVCVSLRGPRKEKSDVR